MALYPNDDQTTNNRLSDPEIAFARELLVWLCQEQIIGSIALRNALLALLRYDPGGTST